MLKYRILSALVLVPLVVLAVLKLDIGNFALLAALAVMLGGWEWSALIPLRQPLLRAGYLLLLLGLLTLVWKFAQLEVLVNIALWLAMLWWLFALFWISRPQLGGGETVFHSVMKGGLGIGLLVSTWLALVVLHSRPDQGPHWVLYVLVLVWVADSGAFFAGRLADRFGRRGIMRVAAVFFIASAWGSGVASGSAEFVLFRVLGGLAVGAASVLAPAYISEVAPARYRGSLATVQQVAIISGLFVAFISNYLLAGAAGSSMAEFWLGFEAWRWMFWIEILLFLIPGIMLRTGRVQTSIGCMFRSSLFILLGGTMYRFDAYLVGFNPGPGWSYFPSIPEIVVTLGLVALEVLVFILLVKSFPILSGTSPMAADRK